MLSIVLYLCKSFFNHQAVLEINCSRNGDSAASSMNEGVPEITA